MLKHVVELLWQYSYEPVSIDATIVAEAPKLAPHILNMRETLKDVLFIPVEYISIKAKTNEGLDSIGRGEAMAAHAVALIAKRRI
jgi:2-C-methyl-D-erythritol 2,4-cyclodiphosphate synthase